MIQTEQERVREIEQDRIRSKVSAAGIDHLFKTAREKASAAASAGRGTYFARSRQPSDLLPAKLLVAVSDLDSAYTACGEMAVDLRPRDSFGVARLVVSLGKLETMAADVDELSKQLAERD